MEIRIIIVSLDVQGHEGHILLKYYLGIIQFVEYLGLAHSFLDDVK